MVLLGIGHRVELVVAIDDEGVVVDVVDLGVVAAVAAVALVAVVGLGVAQVEGPDAGVIEPKVNQDTAAGGGGRQGDVEGAAGTALAV